MSEPWCRKCEGDGRIDTDDPQCFTEAELAALGVRVTKIHRDKKIAAVRRALLAALVVGLFWAALVLVLSLVP